MIYLSSLSKVITASLNGAEGEIINVELHLTNGFPCLNIVGLPDITVRESKERVRSAIIMAGFKFPNKRMTVNLYPGNVRKGGTHFDLPIAVGILAAKYEISSENLKNIAIFGELSLNGEVKKIRGALPLTLCAIENKFKTCNT